MKPRVEKVVDQESVQWIENDAKLDAQFFKTAYREALTEAHDDLARRQAAQVGQHSREVITWLAIIATLVISLPFASIADSSAFIYLVSFTLAAVFARLAVLLLEPSRPRHRSAK
jgi:hypothetical protein